MRILVENRREEVPGANSDSILDRSEIWNSDQPGMDKLTNHQGMVVEI